MAPPKPIGRKDIMASSLLERYHSLLADIETCAHRHGRSSSEISLIAVTKNQPLCCIEELYAAGQRQFAESRLQASIDKIACAPSDIEWHYIGPLQKNKVRKVLSLFSLIHSVDSLDLAEKINGCSAEISGITPILLQVNTSGESTKQGMSMEACEKACDQILSLPWLSVKGLMTMAPLTTDRNEIRSCFAKLRQLRERLQAHYGKESFEHLSMGMSHDYHEAIAEGATLLRIGSALFVD